MSEGKDEIIIDVETGDDGTQEKIPQKPAKQLAPVTKFFIVTFSALLIYHLVSSWMANRKINELNEKISGLTSEMGDLKLENQKLSDRASSLTNDLSKTKTNLDFIDSDRLKKSNEINELKTIIESLKKNIPEGSKLLVQSLENKLKLWEEYQKTLEKTLKSRPDK